MRRLLERICRKDEHVGIQHVKIQVQAYMYLFFYKISCYFFFLSHIFFFANFVKFLSHQIEDHIESLKLGLVITKNNVNRSNALGKGTCNPCIIIYISDISTNQ